MVAGAVGGFLAAIVVLAIVGAPFWLWVLGLIAGMFIGAVLVGMVS